MRTGFVSSGAWSQHVEAMRAFALDKSAQVVRSEFGKARKGCPLTQAGKGIAFQERCVSHRSVSRV
eukprot:COSAG02_NODE_26860_length_622_cov_1.005736_1_plen_65_part_10